LAGNIKFGPDVEHLTETTGQDGEEARDPDWWQEHLAPSAQRKDEMARAIQDYVGTPISCTQQVANRSKQLPNINPDLLTPDYAGIRPNLSPPGSPFTDFHISYDPRARPGLIALCGFNSPGLTSSLAVAEDVEEMVRQDYWGLP
jgi:2-hydroxyglutarate dehydrogenase